MSKKRFQAGGVVDEDELYSDITLSGDKSQADVTSLESLDDIDRVEGDEDAIIQVPDSDEDEDESDLTGVEQFLTQYGVRGGIITYEDGASARFVDLPAKEQAEILQSLVLDSVPTVEEKYNLEDTEIDLLNSLRESNLTPDEFINNLVSRRAQVLDAQREAEFLDYSNISDDALFIFQLQESNPDITDSEIERELEIAKSLSSYGSTVNMLRKSLAMEQEGLLRETQQEQAQAFQEELEAQRSLIVRTVEDIHSIGGAKITGPMKEFLLHDIMELNDNSDPILMEKLFSDPEVLFKANWFINYGESYMSEIDNYWKNEVSKARKEGYMQATKGMPGVPTGVPGKYAAPAKGQAGAPGTFGRELSEEELFQER